MDKLFNGISVALKGLCCVVLTVMSVIVFMQVVNRNIFDGAFVWVEELAGLCMVGITFLGAALATSQNQHTRIDFIILKLPKRGTKIMYIFGNAVCAVFVAFMAYNAVPLIQKTWNSLTPTLKLPFAINYISVLISAVLMLIYFGALIVRDFQELRHIPKGTKNDENAAMEGSVEEVLEK